MRRELLDRLMCWAVLAALLGATTLGLTPVGAKKKAPSIGPDDVTYRLFQLLDSAHGGKLSDFYIITGVYRDPASDAEQQRVLRAEYDKNRAFGKLSLYVRLVAKLSPEQLKTYTPRQIYEFGMVDGEKYVKSEPGPFGGQGDVYLRAEGDRPLASFPITDDVRKAYERLITQYLLPALEKK